MPTNFAQAANGVLLMADGFGPVLRWDGLSPQAETAGVVPPSSALTLSGSGFGPIVGSYTAYTRFVDRFGNLSSLSPVSNVYSAGGATGNVTDATNAAPIVIESTGHGLLSGDTVKVQNVAGNTAANGTFTITVVDADHFSLDGSAGDGDYLGAGEWVKGQATITFAHVPTSTEPKVTRRQILRSTDGEADTYYVDVDTTDLTSTTFSSTKTDSDLQAQTSESIFDSSGAPLANRFGIPPDWKTAIAAHQSRMFLAADLVYTTGSVAVTTGSKTVTGIGTLWPSNWTGRYLWVNGGDQAYLIDAVDADAQTLTLDTAYLGPTDPYAGYAVRPAIGERRLVYWSQAGFPEGWLPSDAFALEEDADDITGLMPMGSFLYVLEKRHVYRMTFQSDPATDGAVFLSTQRGCVNNRCWVTVDGTAYMLDYEGVHAFGGGQDSQPVSEPISRLFNPNVTDQKYRVNWQGSDYFFALHFAPEHAIRWFVSLSGQTVPRHALCFNYREQRWWIEEYQSPIGGACYGYLRGVPQQFLGTSARRILAGSFGTLDGPDPSAGTVRGTVTAAGPDWIEDAGASFAMANLVLSPMAIVSGTGKGQVRLVASVSGPRLNVKEPWLVQPDTTSVYQLGAVPWHYTTGWFRFAEGEELNERRLEILFLPTRTEATMDLRLRLDFSGDPVAWGTTMNSSAGNGVASLKGSSDLVCDLTKRNGFLQKRLPGFRELYLDGKRFVQLELAGFATRDPQAIYQLILDGAMPGE
jgi:hypothetical protein